jgi:hypothetical protein
MVKNNYIFGLQRTGTNYLSELLWRNFNSRNLNRQSEAWKHSIEPYEPEIINPYCLIFCIRKNPYLWVESLCIRNHVDWLYRQTDYPADERDVSEDYLLGEERLNIINLAKTYRDWACNWCVNGCDYPVRYIRYEDLLDDLELDYFLNSLAKPMGFKRPVDGWRLVMPGEVSQSRNFTERMKEAYELQKPQYLTRKQIDAINDTIGKDLIKSLGYRVR